MADESTESHVTGKNANGKFTAGHRFSVGNKGNYHPRTLRSQIVAETTLDQVRVLLDNLYNRAINEGNVSAARLWLDAILGKQKTEIEVSGPGGMPLITQVIMPVMMRVLENHPAVKEEVAQALAQLQLDPPAGGSDHSTSETPSL